MKDYKPAFPRLISGSVMAFTLLLRAAVGQGTSPAGTYGYAANVYLVDSVGSNGAALLGLMSFDGAGNVSGTVTLQPRGPQVTPKAVTGNFTGTYSSNPDGTISAKLMFPFGTFSFDMVVTDGGQGLQFVSTDTYAGSNATFQGSSPQSLSGGLPIKLFNTNLSGGISVSLTGTGSGS